MAITDCRNHINTYSGIDPVIVAYLTRHVNGLMCTEIESVITQLIRERIEAGCDESASNFLKSMPRSVVRNAKYAEIRDKIALFGAQYRLQFEEAVNNSVGEEGIQALGIAVGKRNDAAHREPPDITFREMERAYAAATAIVRAASIVLQVV